MKNVQETLKTVDEDELIKLYLQIYPININDFPDDLTIVDAKTIVNRRLRKFLHRLQNIEIKPPSDNNYGLFYVCHTLDEQAIPDTNYDLVFLNDLYENGVNATPYAYDFTEQAEVMGYLIADNPLTQYWLDYLLVDIMNEVSFFGYNQEYLKEEKDDLLKSIKEVDEGRVETHSVEEILGDDTADQLSDKEEAIEEKVIQYSGDFNQCSKKQELQLFLNNHPNNNIF